MKEERFMAQLGIVDHQLASLIGRDVIPWERGVHYTICVNVYLMVCYLIEWIAEGNGIHLGKRSIETYFRVLSGHAFDKGSVFSQLSMYAIELSYYESLYQGSDLWSGYNADAVHNMFSIVSDFVKSRENWEDD